MPSAAGIILATGGMTLANEFLQNQGPVDPTAPVASKVDWKIIPATAIAAVIFFGIEQLSAPVAKGLAYLTFFTAFVGGDLLDSKYATRTVPDPNHPGQVIEKQGFTTPMGTLLKTFGFTAGSIQDPFLPPGSTTIHGGVPFTTQ